MRTLLRFWNTSSGEQDYAPFFQGATMQRFVKGGLGVIAGLLFFSAAHAETPPVTFPERWKVEEKTSDRTTIWTGDLVVSGASLAMVSIVKVTGVKLDIRPALQLAVRSQQVSLGDKSAICEEIDIVVVDGRDAATAICEYTTSHIKIHFTTIAVGDTSYMLSFTAKTPSFAKNFPQWKTMLAGAKFK